MEVSRLVEKAKREVRNGNTAEAVKVCDSVLSRFPGNVRARNLRSKALSLGGAAAAVDLDVAVKCLDAGELTKAQAIADACLTGDPNSVAARLVGGVARARRGDLAGAIALLSEARDLAPDHLAVRINLTSALFNADRRTEAEDMAQRTIALDPDNVSALQVLGHCYLDRGDRVAALDVFQQIADAGPDHVDTIVSVGSSLAQAGQSSEAMKAFLTALERDPDHLDAHLKLADVLRRSGEPAAALSFYQKAAQISPVSAEAQHGMGDCFFSMRKVDTSALHYLSAIELDPNYTPSFMGLANCRTLSGDRGEATALLEHVVQSKPENDEALSGLIHAQSRNCDWRALENYPNRVPYLGVGRLPVIPFNLLALDDDPVRFRRRAENFTKAVYPAALDRAFTPPHVRPERLKVGFFSSDFHDHATMFLMARMFEVLDRDRFEPIIFSYGGVSQGEMRARLEATDLLMHDVDHLSDGQIADFGRQCGLDIAIDLKGHTTGTRMGLFSFGVAPIQMHYLGYPGTLGSDFIDYFFADAHVLPDNWPEAMSEKIIVLPNSYQVNDDQRPIASATQDRASAGLPQNGFVFASFNDPFKITPDLFEIWMTLLEQTPGAVLWLYAPRDGVRENLRRRAQTHGIDPDRLVFAARQDQADHLSRLRLADLFLDSFVCCAHTTAGDALWAGLPLLTCRGNAFQGRVAASLLHAAGLPELITESSSAYLQTALDLAQDPLRLQALTSKLRETRDTSPLFDTVRFTRNFERGLDMAYDRFLAGLPPDHLVVTEITQ